MSEWRPIETLEEDWRVLLWNGERHLIGSLLITNSGSRRWRLQEVSISEDSLIRMGRKPPTHWAPLLEPPADN